MKIGRLKSVEKQSALFEVDRLLLTTGAKRSWVGDFFEEATSKLTGAKRVKTSGEADICPDLMFSAKTFFECKGVGNTGQAIMYDNRFDKDRRFIDEEGVQLFYWFWRHRFGVVGADSMNELRRGLGATSFAVGVIDRATLEAVIAGREKRQINSQYMKSGGRNGYGSKGYGMGWAFPTKLVFDRCPVRRRVARTVYGVAVEVEFCAFDPLCLDFIA